MRNYEKLLQEIKKQVIYTFLSREDILIIVALKKYIQT